MSHKQNTKQLGIFVFEHLVCFAPVWLQKSHNNDSSRDK